MLAFAGFLFLISGGIRKGSGIAHEGDCSVNRAEGV
jgi:hypothetical protein